MGNKSRNQRTEGGGNARWFLNRKKKSKKAKRVAKRSRARNRGEVGIGILIMLAIGALVGFGLKLHQKKRCLEDMDYLPQCEALYGETINPVIPETLP